MYRVTPVPLTGTTPPPDVTADVVHAVAESDASVFVSTQGEPADPFLPEVPDPSVAPLAALDALSTRNPMESDCEISADTALLPQNITTPDARPATTNYTLARLLDVSPQAPTVVLIRGGYGSGKTTLLCHLSHRLASQHGKPVLVTDTHMMGLGNGPQAFEGLLLKELCQGFPEFTPTGEGSSLVEFNAWAKERFSAPVIVGIDEMTEAVSRPAYRNWLFERIRQCDALQFILVVHSHQDLDLTGSLPDIRYAEIIPPPLSHEQATRWLALHPSLGGTWEKLLVAELGDEILAQCGGQPLLMEEVVRKMGLAQDDGSPLNRTALATVIDQVIYEGQAVKRQSTLWSKMALPTLNLAAILVQLSSTGQTVPVTGLNSDMLSSLCYLQKIGWVEIRPNQELRFRNPLVAQWLRDNTKVTNRISEPENHASYINLFTTLTGRAPSDADLPWTA